ncbi:hypothetical protein DHC50_04655 [Arenibacter sp. A80]|nr:hypothetical protein [Arenibacter sp. A80]RFT56925.1 hypothetical protein D0S24_04655 [Arenibacter sp. P308M17]
MVLDLITTNAKAGLLLYPVYPNYNCRSLSENGTNQIKKLFKFYPLVLLVPLRQLAPSLKTATSCFLNVRSYHASAIFRSVAMAMYLKIPSPYENLPAGRQKYTIKYSKNKIQTVSM